MLDLISRSNPEEIFVPPVNFSMVAKGIYRGSYPNFSNFSFLKNLGLKTILFLCEEDYMPINANFLKENGISLLTVQMEANKAPFKAIPKEQIIEALRYLTDERNHPIYVHCDNGTHRTGTVIGCLRKLQNWSLSSIFDEYRCFAGTKAKQIDERYIELFDPPKNAFNADYFPSWLKEVD